MKLKYKTTKPKLTNHKPDRKPAKQPSERARQAAKYKEPPTFPDGTPFPFNQPLGADAYVQTPGSERQAYLIQMLTEREAACKKP